MTERSRTGPGGADPASDETSAGALQHFVSGPDLTPPAVHVTRPGLGPDARLTFLNAPSTRPGHGGSTIRDAAGGLIWFGRNTAPHHRMGVSTQAHRGKPVLTWWQSQITPAGFGLGDCVIADSSYRVTRTIRAHCGLQADLHEFTLTPQGTALITAYRIRRATTAARAGFETGIAVPGAGPHYAVEARNASGHVLGRSAVVTRP